MRIKEILMADGMPENEAVELFEDAKAAFDRYLDEDDIDSAYNVCQEFFGLEPDYVNELVTGGLIMKPEKNMTIRFPADLHRVLKIKHIDGEIESIQAEVIKVLTEKHMKQARK